MTSSSPKRPGPHISSSPAPTSPLSVNSTDAVSSPMQHHSAPLRARLQALLHHTDSHSSASPLASPTSDSTSNHRSYAHAQSSSTSLDSMNHARDPLKRNKPRGAISVLPRSSPTSSILPAASLTSSPPPKLAALPRSVTTSQLDKAASRSATSDSHSSGPSRASSLDPTHLAADHSLDPPLEPHSNQVPRKQTPQRPSIKVRIITWNMHDSVPKGDLQVLLGKAGQYVAPDPDWDISYESDDDKHSLDNASKLPRGAHVVGQEHIPRSDRIPPLPHDDSHPYHLLVIAGQECPWGDGKRLATSVGMANELGDFGKQKNRAARDKDNAKEATKDKNKPIKNKDKNKSGDSDNLPNPSEGSKTADDAPVTNKDGLSLPAEDQGFPFYSSSASSAHPGHPTRSPFIGGSSTPNFSATTEAGQDDRLGWPNIGGKGWSDLCEDWLCRNQIATKREKDHHAKSFISGARLARALSQSTKKEFTLSRENLADHNNSMPTHSLSAAVTPELSRAASPIGIPVSASVPGTPPHNAEAFSAFVDADVGTSSAAAEKRKRLVPKLNLNPVDLVKRSAPSGRSSPALYIDSDCVSSPVLLSPTALLPKGGNPLCPSTQPMSQAQAGEPSTLPASTSTAGLLAVPGTPTMSRMSSSNSLSRLAEAAEHASRGASPAGTELHVEPPTPSRSPSPLPSTVEASSQNRPIVRDTASPAPSAAGNTANEGNYSQRSLEKSFAETIPKALGPYELVIKERMMGCYMAVYVWRGCKDRVRGASRSHVKSGLLAGRVGNKGGVGISLKLGTTRLLFVNAHLAAHEDKVALRLANVAKIKAALKVDSFLAPGDPRAKLEDITEQFDHTFWFGDLNFRIDISRQHADWLMMNKKYDQALAFDQLGKVLKEGDAFKGFKEAPINFPPTYKYDVLKTLKIKRNKTLSSVRSGVDIPGASSVASSKNGGAELSTTPLGESVIPEEGMVPPDCDEVHAAGDVSGSYATPDDPDLSGLPGPDESFQLSSTRGNLPSSVVQGKCDGTESAEADRSDEDRYSIASSSAFGSMTSSSGFAHSYQTQEARLTQHLGPALLRERELELQRQRQLAENTSAAQGPRFFSQGAAIKAKFKLMDMVRNAANSNLKEKLGNAVSGENNGGNGKRKWLSILKEEPRRATGPQPGPKDDHAFAAPNPPAIETPVTTHDDSSFVGGRRGSVMSTDGHLSSAGHDDTTDRESVASTAGSAPASANPRVSSMQMAKASALAAAKAHRDAKYPHLTGATAEQIDFLEAQPYDTSAKQRVPSWCDRVLFRSTVPAEDGDSDEAAEASGSRPSHESGLGSRVGSALSNALIMPLRQAAERRHQLQAQRSTSTGLIAAVAGGSSIAFAQEQTVPPEASLVDPIARKASAARRERKQTSSSPHLPLNSDSAETRTLAGIERPTRHPHLLERFLHPHRRSHHSKALSPSLTLLDLEPSPAVWRGQNESVDMLMPTAASSSTIGEEAGLGLGLGLGLEPKATSTVDLPSQLEERDKRFDGAAKKVGPARVGVNGEMQARVVIPPRQSSSSGRAPAPRASEGDAEAPTRSATDGPPRMPTRVVAAPPARRTHSGADSGRAGSGGWMDSLSSHLPSFFHALRSHRPGSLLVDATTPDDKPSENAAEGDEHCVVGPKKGRIECLLYKALDDREMRMLEGRSDHRPVIFVGAIGI